MSIDTVSSRPDAPVAPLALAAPPIIDPPAPDLPPPPPPAASATLRLEARRLRAVHELADRITRLEQELLEQSQALERTRVSTRDSLRELQQRSASLTTELLRGQARTARQDREHAEERRRLESRVAAQLRELESSLPPLQQALQSCTGELAALQDRQATLERLNLHLDRLVLRQGRQLDLVTAEFRQQMELLRAAQDTFREDLASQQSALMALTLDHEQASLNLERLRSAHDNLAARTDARLQRLAQRQRVFASLLAALALLSLTLIAWCYTHPATVPPAARQQLQQLAVTTQRQDDLAQTQAQVLAGHDLRLAEQQAALELAREHNDDLRADTRRQQREITRLRLQLATLQANLAAITQASPPGHTPVTEPAVTAALH